MNNFAKISFWVIEQLFVASGKTLFNVVLAVCIVFLLDSLSVLTDMVEHVGAFCILPLDFALVPLCSTACLCLA